MNKKLFTFYRDGKASRMIYDCSIYSHDRGTARRISILISGARRKNGDTKSSTNGTGNANNNFKNDRKNLFFTHGSEI